MWVSDLHTVKAILEGRSREGQATDLRLPLKTARKKKEGQSSLLTRDDHSSYLLKMLTEFSLLSQLPMME